LRSPPESPPSGESPEGSRRPRSRRPPGRLDREGEARSGHIGTARRGCLKDVGFPHRRRLRAGSGARGIPDRRGARLGCGDARLRRRLLPTAARVRKQSPDTSRTMGNAPWARLLACFCSVSVAATWRSMFGTCRGRQFANQSLKPCSVSSLPSPTEQIRMIAPALTTRALCVAMKNVLKQVKTQRKQLQFNLEVAEDPLHKRSSLRTYRDAYHRTNRCATYSTNMIAPRKGLVDGDGRIQRSTARRDL
jgi:hypothetical protein